MSTLPRQMTDTGHVWSLTRDNQLRTQLEGFFEYTTGHGVVSGGGVSVVSGLTVQFAASTVFVCEGVYLSLSAAQNYTLPDNSTVNVRGLLTRTAADPAAPTSSDTYSLTVTHTTDGSRPGSLYVPLSIHVTSGGAVSSSDDCPPGKYLTALSAPISFSRNCVGTWESQYLHTDDRAVTYDVLTVDGTLTVDGILYVLDRPADGAAAEAPSRVSSNDQTTGFLNGKLVPGSGITFTENNDGGDETLTITSTSGGAPSDAQYIVATANGTLTNEQNLGALSDGLLRQTVSGAVATLAIATAGTHYYAPGGTDVALVDGGSGASTAAGARANFETQEKVGWAWSGLPTASQKSALYVATRSITFPANFSGSYGLALAAATASTTLTLKKLTTAGVASTVGTAVWAVGAFTPTFTTSGGSSFTLTAGQGLYAEAPASPDATLSSPALTIVGD